MKSEHHIPIGSFGKTLYKLFAKGETSAEDNFEKKTYGEKIAEDNFSEGINEKLKITISPSNFRYTENYKNDLSRFGTPEGLIDVSNDELTKNKKKQKLMNIKKCSEKLSKQQYKKIMSKGKLHKPQPYSANPYSDIFKEFPKIQVTIHNTAIDEKEVILWGANQSVGVSAPSPTDVQDHTISTQISIPSGIHPQGIVFNPVNNLVYVANQLSGTVTVIDSNNQVIKVIQLQPSFPGFCSPVALAANTNSSGSKYGFVYVACSVANTINVIDLLLNVTTEIPVGIRPVSVAFNPVNNLIYVANLVSNNISVIDPETNAPVIGSPLPSGGNPIGIGINPTSGEIYIANSISNDVTVYNSSNALVTTIPAIGLRPVTVTYNPANGFMYAVATDNDTVYQIDPVTHTILTVIPVGPSPYNTFFDSANNFLYVQNRGDNSFTIISPGNSIVATINLGVQSMGGTFNSNNNFIYVSDTTNNIINVIGYLSSSSSISVSSDYGEINENFQNSPAIVLHTKFVVAGQQRISRFRVNKFTPTGTSRTRPISFELYASPQHTLNVAEVTELAGNVIDGKMNWRFILPGLHTVSILVWYRQFEVQELLKNNKC